MDRDRIGDLDLLSIQNGIAQAGASSGYVPYPNTTAPGPSLLWNHQVGNVEWDKEFKPGCSANSHVFECRHELRCRCGQTYRAEALAVPKGL